MSDRAELTFVPPKGRQWVVSLIGAAALAATAVQWYTVGSLTDEWIIFTLCFGIPASILPPYMAHVQLHVDANGLRIRTPLKRSYIPWHDVTEVQVTVETAWGFEIRRVTLLLHGGRTRKLPVPYDRSPRSLDPHFDLKVAQLRALHRATARP
ncbi:PH domain-containing protein [Streptomyces sp. TR02-1]|uniref:PH domain-containing protein n=1 Tax=Streptomyces sp. TR02-1 TaxID=3385977 RepID=UPI00399F3CC0